MFMMLHFNVSLSLSFLLYGEDNRTSALSESLLRQKRRMSNAETPQKFPLKKEAIMKDCQQQYREHLNKKSCGAFGSLLVYYLCTRYLPSWWLLDIVLQQNIITMIMNQVANQRKCLFQRLYILQHAIMLSRYLVYFLVYVICTSAVLLWVVISLYHQRIKYSVAS